MRQELGLRKRSRENQHGSRKGQINSTANWRFHAQPPKQEQAAMRKAGEEGLTDVHMALREKSTAGRPAKVDPDDRPEERNLGWAGVLFGLLDLNGSTVEAMIHMASLSSFATGKLEAVTCEVGKAAATDRETVWIELGDGAQHTEPLIDGQRFEGGCWQNGLLGIYATDTNVWIGASGP